MKIYLAGPCSKEERPMMEAIAAALRAKGIYDVYCPFELKIPNAWDYPQEIWAQKVFESDMAAIDECDFMIMISKGRASTAGTNWEQGYVYAINKPIFVYQSTEAETSLMTYCGCDRFFNFDDWKGDPQWIADYLYEEFVPVWSHNERTYTECKTVLT